MRAYLDLMRDALDNGAVKSDRTGVGVRSLFGRQLRFDLAEGFPLVTTKRLHIKSIVRELIWFLRGTRMSPTSRRTAFPSGTNGPTRRAISVRFTASSGARGKGRTGALTIRSPGSSTRFAAIPNSRRLIVSAWNVAEIERMKLAPCHCLFQFYVSGGKLSCQLYQRSADIFLGVPFNIASYALLTHLVARECGLEAGEFVHTFGDAHLYRNHEEQARAQLAREPRPLPRLKLGDVGSIFDLDADAIQFEGYDPWPAIKAKVAV